MRQITLLALLLGAAVAPRTASAQGWSDFGSAFPLFPCQDGWVGCIVDEQPVSPEMQADSTGAPVPADMRVGWFDLKPTAAFSPFVELSRYTGAAPAVAAAEVEAATDAEPTPPPEPVAPPEPSPEQVAAAQAAEQAAQEAERREAERRAAEEAAKEAAAEQEEQRRLAAQAERRQRELEAQATAAADAAEKERLRKQAEEEAKRLAAAEEARRKAEEEARRREEERLAKQRAEEEARRKAEEAEKARLAAEAEARRKAERVAAEEAARKKAEEEARRKAEEEKAAAAAVAAADQAKAEAAAAEPASCEIDQLVRLEPMAMLGKLSLAQTKSCESTLEAAARMTDKEKISRVLMVNAFSKGDKVTWERLVKRHLDEIDQSDPDLCYKYALHLSKQGPGRATGVIRWANVALENRTVWTGDTYTSRVYSLYKLRAAAAQQLWQKAEQDHVASPSDQTKKKSEDYRAQTKVLAREWYEYAKVAGKDTTTALQLCISAAGTADYCEAG